MISTSFARMTLLLLAMIALQAMSSPVSAAAGRRHSIHHQGQERADGHELPLTQLPRRAPAPPDGAHISQHKPSKVTNATVPIFVNKAWVDKADGGKAGRGITKAWIGLHGKGRDGVATFQDLYPIVGSSGALIIPNFYAPDDIGHSTTDGVHASYLDADRNMLWNKEGWSVARDAVQGGRKRPLNGAQISSFDVVDSLVERLSDKGLYPNLKRIIIVGHSAGGLFVDLYARFGKSTSDGNIKFRYITANPPLNYFEDRTRPVDGQDYLAGCPEYNDFPAGSSGMIPRYVSTTGKRMSFAKSVSRDVIRLAGSRDVYKAGYEVPRCDAVAQGGLDRLARNQNAWVIENLRAKSGKDLSMYRGYQNLTSQAKPVATDAGAPLLFKRTFAIVPGVGHDSGKMFSSNFGRQALLSSSGVSYTPHLEGNQSYVPY
ncbi:hypothetical protein IE81DRAFT_59625 [Ceraceosorus guamensis]|uniref:AB hydrolase-1 domain-containing protein n=1 Tax=Ceraceosorus guamensis TaxID=1522189 RepID=A0A316W544_9BASI|nr:hypothetical protein IE81DRAFT_59625 [Ceraceosorus guamensis]PWN43811.1 hypothetical protein IE81DRAFT_59625 [Ceraceosorus guamensis]